MKRIAVSVYTFENLIVNRFLYIDKTEYIWKLVSSAPAMYFLSRPRRFGKSLAVSTLMAAFEGKKELFGGLAIHDKPYDWKPHPVIFPDMNGWDFSSVGRLEKSLRNLVRETAAAHALTLTPSDASDMFRELIDRLSERERAVILIDEYDKPLLDNLGKPHARKILEKMKAFYSVIKACERKERFVFVTGVTRFRGVSPLSGLDNLNDISMDYNYATMFGYTQAELEKYFADRIDLACEQSGESRGKLLDEPEKWYGGYRFHGEAESVYNPVSLAQFFSRRGEFNSYWSSTGSRRS